MTKAEEQAQRTTDALDTLRAIIQPGDTLTINTEYSKSGMVRWTTVYAAIINPTTQRPEVKDITWDVAHAINEKPFDRGGWTIKGTGWGYSHATDITYSLSKRLGWDPYAIKHTGNGW